MIKRNEGNSRLLAHYRIIKRPNGNRIDLEKCHTLSTPQNNTNNTFDLIHFRIVSRYFFFQIEITKKRNSRNRQNTKLGIIWYLWANRNSTRNSQKNTNQTPTLRSNFAFRLFWRLFYFLHKTKKETNIRTKLIFIHHIHEMDRMAVCVTAFVARLKCCCVFRKVFFPLN